MENRKIKFRAWFEQTHTSRPSSFRWEYISVNEAMDLLLESYLKQKSPWLQFTGVKDKHGKDLYEGDIVIGSSMMEDNVKGVIKFIDGAFSHSESSIGWEGETLISLKYCEVIGNIYEHPELLNQSPSSKQERE